MADLVVIVPSRGRPEAAEELAANFADTCTADTVLCFAIDADDPRLPGYKGVVQVAQARGQLVGEVTVTGGRNMVDALNHTAAWMVKPENAHPPFAVGFMGDDHRPRTVGWDAAYLEALRGLGTGIVYGNDLLQGPRIPTQVAMTSDIVRALGYMAPPEFTHLWVDNFWLELGTALGRLRYLPDVVVEHMHPLAGKGDWDDGYRRVNSPAVASHDQAAFDTYMRTRFAGDLAKVQAAIGVTG